MNLTVFSGRLTADPELKTTSTGKAVCTVSIAVDDGFGDKKRTYFPSIVLWEGKAKYVAEYGKKGDLMIVRCRYSQRDYENKEGKKVRIHEFLADEVNVISTKAHSEDSTVAMKQKEDFIPIDNRFEDDKLPF